MTSVGLRRLVPLGGVFPVGSSADSAESASFRERWFNASNEADLAESSRGVVGSPSKRVRRPFSHNRHFETTAKRAYIRVEHINRDASRFLDRDDPRLRHSYVISQFTLRHTGTFA